MRTRAVAAVGMPLGSLLPWTGRAAAIPSGWLGAEGQAISRTTYPALFALCCKVASTAAAVVTITIASPGVVTVAGGHALAADAQVVLYTTGALPTGLTAGQIYYVRNPTATTFEVSATPGGASINTSGTQSGQQSYYASSSTVAIASPGVVTWPSHGLEVHDPVKFSTNGALPTGLVAGTTYYVRASGLTADAFSVTSSPGSGAINFTGSQSGQHIAIHAPYGDGDGSTTFNVCDMAGRFPIGRGSGSGLSGAAPGIGGGAESRAITTTELPAHTHEYQASSTGLGGGGGNFMVAGTGFATSSTGTGTALVTTPPRRGIRWLVKVVP